MLRALCVACLLNTGALAQEASQQESGSSAVNSSSNHPSSGLTAQAKVAAPAKVVASAEVEAPAEDASNANESVPETAVAPTATPKPAKNIDLKEVVENPMPAVEVVPPAEGAPLVLDAAEKERQERRKEALEDEPGILKSLKEELVGSPEEQPSLVLLGAEVAPGTSTRLEWSPSVSFMGISAPTAVLVLNGMKAGPTLCLTAAVHGDELNGIEIVRRVMYDIDPQELSGAVIGVPIVNLQGFRRSSRYLPDRRDLNRFFPGNPRGSSAARIAASFFHNVVKHCDLLIDLHTGSFRRTNLPQLRADLTAPEVAKFAKKMGAIVVVHSEGAPGCLRRASVEAGIPSVTLEAGAPHELQRESVEHGVKSIESAMDNLGMIDRRRFWERPAEPVYYQSTWVRAIDGGILFSEVELGDSIRKGDLLGVVTDPITNARSEIIAPYNGRVIGMALNQVMYPGFAAYHIGLQASVENVAKEQADQQGDGNPNQVPQTPIDSNVPVELEDEAEPSEFVPIEDSE